MIYRFENIESFDKRLLRAFEPFIEYNLSKTKDGYINNWTVHSRVKSGKHYQVLRTYKFDQIRQGFICTSFDKMITLSYYLDCPSDFKTLEIEYEWLQEYVYQFEDKNLIKRICLPLSEYIKHYSSNNKMLELVNFEELFNWHD